MTDIVNHLQTWGLKVQTKDGYVDRGRPYSFHPQGVLCHHTASGALTGNFGSESIVTYGRSDLPGPLCQFLLGRDGTVKVIANGYANHAGYGGPRAGIPENLGNTYMYGIEAENNGIGERWSAPQLNAYYRLCAALLDYMNIDDINKVFGHKEWTSRKIDPTGINMDQFRAEVRKALDEGDSVVNLKLSNLRPGKRNTDVWRLKFRLKKTGHFKGKLVKNGKKAKLYDGQLVAAVARYQRQKLGKKVGNGVVGKAVVERLGFRAV